MSATGRHTAMMTLVSALWTFAALMPWGTVAAAQGAAKAPPPRWQVEVIGGYAFLAPKDLNSEADYLAALVNDLESQPIRQTHDGTLETITGGTPAGARVMVGFGRHWAVGAAFSFLSVTRQSSSSATYSYSLVNPRAQEYQREYAETDTVDPLVLKAREYVAQAVLRYDRPWSRHLCLGASVGAGWLVADNQLEYARTNEGGFYPYRRSSSWAMDGSGKGPAVNGWLTARVAVTRRVGLLVEGGYAWHQVRTVKGSAAFEGTTQDGEAAEVELSRTYRANGRWVNQSTTFQSGVDRWEGTIPAVGADGSPYTLNLSGWRINLGLSLGL